MRGASLGLGYWTARLCVFVLSFGTMRVQAPGENLSNGVRVLEKGRAAVFGAFLFAAGVTGAAVAVTGGQL